MSDRHALVETTMRLLAAGGWANLSLSTIAAKSGLSLAQVRALAPAKPALLCRLADEIDDAVLQAITPGAFAAETPRERLFEVLMQRFDALKPYKPGLRRLGQDIRCDPALGGLLALLLPRSMLWMAEAAQVPLTGWLGPLKLAGLTALYLRTLHVWLDDDSEEGGKTMATLDRLLRQMSDVGCRMSGNRPKSDI